MCLGLGAGKSKSKSSCFDIYSVPVSGPAVDGYISVRVEKINSLYNLLCGNLLLVILEIKL